MKSLAVLLAVVVSAAAGGGASADPLDQIIRDRLAPALPAGLDVAKVHLSSALAKLDVDPDRVAVELVRELRAGRSSIKLAVRGKPAQFVDRFGLSVTAASELAPAERAQIVLRRLEFEQAPERFVKRFAAEQRRLRERCAGARERLATLDFVGPGLARVAELCHSAQVEGVRADLAMLRAARAHAVWHERATIEVADVQAVAELALAHRRKAHEEGEWVRAAALAHADKERRRQQRSAA